MPPAPLQLFYCDHYEFALPAGHKFPLQKYRMLREMLENEPGVSLSAALPCSPDDLARVHERHYIEAFLQGTLPDAAIRRIGFPWSEGLVWRTLASAGGTLAATRAALASGIAGNLAGGTHHAFRSEGGGFCIFNDLAIAAEWARREAGAARVAIIDLDVHQGDGTAAIFENDPGVFTLSLHAAGNFPLRKQRSTLDIAFADGTLGSEYLRLLGDALERVWEFRPDLILYQSGVDGLSVDRLGKLALTHEDLRARDVLVIHSARALHVPIAITLGGGYSEPVSETVAAHAQTYRIAAESARSASVGEIARIEA